MNLHQRLGLLLGLITCVACSEATQAADYKVGDKLQAPAAASAVSPPAAATQAPAKRTDFRLVDWDALIPRDWDPLKDFKSLNLGMLNDGDPRAREALDRMRRAWDQAPTEPTMDQQRIRIPGFVVPLDGTAEQLREFLLVPYFGACIHVPPPPANQIIHVVAAKPVAGVRAMDAVWVSGTLHTAISDTAMGSSGYRMEAEIVTPYKERR